MPYVSATVVLLAVVAGCSGSNQRQPPIETSMQVEPHARMNVARAAHTATALPDGRVLIAGGCTSAGCGGISASAELYDPVAGVFLSTAPMSTGRASHAATLLADGKVFVTGGWSGGETTASSELYDAALGSFVVRARMLRARAAHRSIALGDGRVLVLGGEAATGSALASGELYDPSTDRFEAGGELLHPRTNHSATRLRDGRILVVGGRQSRTSVTASAEVFDPTTGESRATGSMALPREKHEAVLLRDGRVLVVGGSDVQESRHATTEIYDPERGVFTAGPSLRSPRYKLSGSIVVTEAGYVVVAGGGEEVESLPPEIGNEFNVLGRMDGLREFTSTIALTDGSILVAGGYDERIRPSASTWIVRLPHQGPGSARSAALPRLAEVDRGVGVVGFSGDGAGTLRIRSHPDSVTDVIAELRRPHDGPYELLAHKAGLQPVLIEYGYEVAGIPFDSVAGRWARVAYGKAADGVQARGWVDLEDGAVEQFSWRDLLLRRRVRFPPGVAPELFISPDGRRLEVPEAVDHPGDYDLSPVHSEGAWLLVRLRAPSVCAGTAFVIDTAAWIRYLDDRGRPYVHAMTRGC